MLGNIDYESVKKLPLFEKKEYLKKRKLELAKRKKDNQRIVRNSRKAIWNAKHFKHLMLKKIFSIDEETNLCFLQVLNQGELKDYTTIQPKRKKG